MDYSKAKVTICPAGKDHRFTANPKEAVPLFGGLRIGSYLDRESWAARVYG